MKPSLVIPALSLSLHYLEYTPASPAFAQNPPATEDQRPALPATSFMGYGYPADMPSALSAPAGTTFMQLQAPQQ